MWDVQVEGPDGAIFQDRGNFIINGTGILKYDLLLHGNITDVADPATIYSKWKWPAVPGLSDFEGKLLHSAAWDDTYDLENKRVGVIGAGSSGVQVVAALQGSKSTLKYVEIETY